MYDYDVLSQDEIDELLEKIDLGERSKRFTELKPKEIEQEYDAIEKESLKKRFKDIKEVYITPLERLLKYHYTRTNKQAYSVDLSESSIEESVIILRKYLLEVGYEVDQLMDLVPKTEEELDVILTAKENGFEDNILSNNKQRVNNAREYLNKTVENRVTKR